MEVNIVNNMVEKMLYFFNSRYKWLFFVLLLALFFWSAFIKIPHLLDIMGALTLVDFLLIFYFMYKTPRVLGVTYDANKAILHVSKTSPLFASVLKINEARDINVKHEEEVIHVGAVRVGSAVSGGAYKTGGYDYQVVGDKNGHYVIEYCGFPVHDIDFDNKEILQKCKNSNASKYIDGNGILVYSSSRSRKKGDASKESPSYIRCKTIYDFLCEKES